jgi:hypothetical protein
VACQELQVESMVRMHYRRFPFVILPPGLYVVLSKELQVVWRIQTCQLLLCAKAAHLKRAENNGLNYMCVIS